MTSVDDTEGDSWGRPGEGRMEESRLDHGIDYGTLKETAHINVAIDKLMVRRVHELMRLRQFQGFSLAPVPHAMLFWGAGAPQ